MMADENVPATDATDDELAAVAGVLYLASAELDDYGVSVSEKKRWTVGVAVLGMDAREARSARAGKARLGGAQPRACASHALASGMSALVPPPPKHDTPPLTKADVPRYVNAILAISAVSQSMGVDDLLRFGIETRSGSSTNAPSLIATLSRTPWTPTMGLDGRSEPSRQYLSVGCPATGSGGIGSGRKTTDPDPRRHP